MVSQTGHSVLQRSETRPKMNWLFSSMHPEKLKVNATSSTAWARTGFAELKPGTLDMRMFAVSALAILALSACGEKPRPTKPFILTDRASIGFDTEFASGTFIGTVPQQSLAITNEGLEDLVISEVSQTGDSAFGFMPTTMPPITVKGAKQTYIQLTFAPTQERMYMGAIVIKSNADNIKELSIGLSGLGIAKRDGG